MLTRMGDVLTSEEAASQILKNPWFYGGSFRFRKKESIRGFTYITYRFRLEGLGSMDRWAQGLGETKYRLYSGLARSLLVTSSS